MVTFVDVRGSAGEFDGDGRTLMDRGEEKLGDGVGNFSLLSPDPANQTLRIKAHLPPTFAYAVTQPPRYTDGVMEKVND